MTDAYEDLFSSGAGDKLHEQKRMKLKVTDLQDFRNHPFKIVEDADMDELIESVRVSGVMEPILVRPVRGGQYEIIAGHRRVNACLMAGICEVEAVVRDMTDEEAVAAMVDTNLFRRKKLLPSELAKALCMRKEAMERLGEKESRVKKIIEKGLMTKTSVYRYMSLNRLPDELLDMVDVGRISVKAGEALASLSVNALKKLAEDLRNNPKVKVDESKAQRLREALKDGEDEDISRILLDRKKRNVSLPKSITELFPKGTDVQEMIEKIIAALQSEKAAKLQDQTEREGKKQ